MNYRPSLGISRGFGPIGGVVHSRCGLTRQAGRAMESAISVARRKGANSPAVLGSDHWKKPVGVRPAVHLL